MSDIYTIPEGLRPKELQAVYTISRAVVRSEDVEAALDEIIQITRPVFIFDNVVLYLPQEGEALEPSYARVIGRGRSAEAELAWGDTTANEAFRSRSTILQTEKMEGWQTDRLCWRDFLGLPLFSGEQIIGALVFGRFGGPPYVAEQVQLAEFIAGHIAQLLEHHKLLERVANLEAERRLKRLQDEFIATISHELNTPLGFIKGYATTLLREDAAWEEETRREFLTIIDEEADRLCVLIENLLDSSRLQSGTMRMQFQPVRLDRLIKEVALRASSRHESLCIELDLKTDAIIPADPVRLAQVFDNILSNAVKYASGSSVFISLEKDNGTLHVAVSDEGPGIAPEHLGYLFERFYRVPETSAGIHGAGLGLFICNQIVQAHSGSITVESELSKGTTFHINLPYIHIQGEKKSSDQEVD